MKYYFSHEATVTVTKPDGQKQFIFDVSRTVECLWIAVSKEEFVLEELGHTRDMLEYVAEQQSEGATVECQGNFLDREAQNEGCDTWQEYVQEQVS